MKKYKKEVKKNKINITMCQSVGVERKKGITLIRSDINKLTEDEVRALLVKISNENKEFHNMYYSVNTPILQIKKRTFSDLLKKFFQVLGSMMNSQMTQMIESQTRYKKN